jgi:hypothetical protein
VSTAVLLIILIVLFFGRIDYKIGIFDFFIGDQGTYSLSRVQAVLWAIVIISYQIGVIIALFINNNGNYFSYYQLAFSESAIWLLGLSLSSYIAVKGISVNQITKDPKLYKSRIGKPRWSDLLIGDNGLDFSRCQMLVWTIIAVFVFESKCYYFSNHLVTDKSEIITKLFKNTYDEYSDSQKPLLPNYPFLPYLPWSFVVLMGLSQGVYVGKKLVPTFKLDDIKQSKQDDLQQNVQVLATKQALLNNIVRKSKPNSSSPNDKANINRLLNEIVLTQQNIDAAKRDILEIDKYKRN